jgi:hypothetical protein
MSECLPFQMTITADVDNRDLNGSVRLIFLLTWVYSLPRTHTPHSQTNRTPAGLAGGGIASGLSPSKLGYEKCENQTTVGWDSIRLTLALVCHVRYDEVAYFATDVGPRSLGLPFGCCVEATRQDGETPARAYLASWPKLVFLDISRCHPNS